MARGGIILTHDYAARDEGVYRAFGEFFDQQTGTRHRAWREPRYRSQTLAELNVTY